MARSEKKTRQAMDSIMTSVPASDGELIFLPLDLSDLENVRTAAKSFLTRESKLDILINNAGVAFPEKGSKTKQGYELMLGVNCLGTFAFTDCLKPALISAANSSPVDTVRVVWVASSAAETVTTKDFIETFDHSEDKAALIQYGNSKLGVYLLATEFARRHKADGILSVSLNPGNLDSDLFRTQGSWTTFFLRMMLYPPVYGAYTILWAAFAQEVTIGVSGRHGKSPRSFLPQLGQD